MRWGDEYAELEGAETGGELERLATAAYMLGREEEYVRVLERAHQAHVEAHAIEAAVRCAFWIGLVLSLRGEAGQANGWLGRGQRLLGERDSVERGYLRLLATLHVPDPEAGHAGAAEAADTGRRFADADLVALAVHEQGHCLVRQGRIAAGLALLDEAMVAVTADALSPVVTGLIYCSVIDGCRHVHELRRAQEWTAAMTRWCEQQPDLVMFTGRCLVHRAEIMQTHGEWREALDEARQAGARIADARAVGQALYRQGELHRLQGDFAAAEDAYREANRHGYEPQPGMALLRLGQGRPAAAAAAIRRAVGETDDPSRLAALLPSHVEIALAAGEPEEARAACSALEAAAEGLPSAMVAALVAETAGAVALAEGDAGAALVSLRAAEAVWRGLDAPYEAARVRARVALACRALGDEDSAALELDAARAVFDRLGARPDVVAVDALAGGAAGGLSPRELQVLRLVAAGSTNRVIAAELVLSERTVDRHVSNILAKLGVPSRAAATAYAYEHGLIG